MIESPIEVIGKDTSPAMNEAMECIEEKSITERISSIFQIWHQQYNKTNTIKPLFLW